MTNKYTAPNNNYFTNLFMPYKSGSKQLVYYQENGVDIGTIYQKYYRGITSNISNFKSFQNGVYVDLSSLFQNINIPLVFGSYVSYSKFNDPLRLFSSNTLTFNITIENVIRYEITINKRDVDDNEIRTDLINISTNSTDTLSSFTIPVTASTTKQSYQPEITLYNDVGNTYTFSCDQIFTEENCKFIRVTGCSGGGGGGSGGQNSYGGERDGGQGGGGGAATYTVMDVYLPFDFPLDTIRQVNGLGGAGGVFSGGSTDNGNDGQDGGSTFIYIGTNRGMYLEGGKGGRGGARNHREPDTGQGLGGAKSIPPTIVNMRHEHTFTSSLYKSYDGYIGKGNQEWDKLMVYDPISNTNVLVGPGYPAGTGGQTYFINPDGVDRLPAENYGSGGKGGLGTSRSTPGVGTKGTDGFFKVELISTYFI